MRSGRPPIDDRVTALQWNSAVHASPPSSNALTLHLPLSKRRPWLRLAWRAWPFARRPVLFHPPRTDPRFPSPLCANATQSATAARKPWRNSTERRKEQRRVGGGSTPALLYTRDLGRHETASPV